MNDELKQAADWFDKAEKIAVLTGAGVSKESGVPTFRDALEGLWAKYDPQELATPEAFARNPGLVWDWYEFRRGLVRNATPNPGHFALAELERRKPELWIITQNVDDLHEQAGSTRVIHLHGNIAATKCSENCRGTPTIVTDFDSSASPPPCPHCGANLRPDVVWFGENLPPRALDQSRDLCINCEVMLVIGTSGLVTPAATLPRYTKQYGGKVIEVNPTDSAITPLADVKLTGASGDVLPRLLAMMDGA